MINNPELITAFMLGLLGSTHCVGMCGGIAGALTISLKPELQKGAGLVTYQLLYAAGRIASYGIIGALAGALGWVLVESLGAQFAVGLRVAAGVLLILLGLYLAGWLNWITVIEKLGGKIWQKLSPLIRALHPIDNPLKAVSLGLLWGWLPCGLVYSTVSLALTSGAPLNGSLLMIAFGLGTLPAVMATGILAQQIRQLLQKALVRNIAGVVIIAFGVFTIVPAIQHAEHNHSSHGSSTESTSTLDQSDMHHHHH